MEAWQKFKEGEKDKKSSSSHIVSRFRHLQPSTLKMFKVFSIFIVLLVSSNCMKWEQWSVDKSEIPKNAVQAGTENGESVYVIRARHADGLYPGKFMPEIKKAFVTYNRKDIPIKKFEVNFRLIFMKF